MFSLARKSQRGDTLIEVLFAMTIIGVILAAAYSVASKNLQVSQLSKERIQATQLATAQLEQLKALDGFGDSAITTSVENGEPFCIDIEAASFIIFDDPGTDEDECLVDEFFSRSIVKKDNLYEVKVEWLPPGGNDNNDPAVVTFSYRDYDFTFAGSENLFISDVDYGGGTTATVSVVLFNTSGANSMCIWYSNTNTNPSYGGTDSSECVSLIPGDSSVEVILNGLTVAGSYYARACTDAAVPVCSGVVAFDSEGVVEPVVENNGSSNISPSGAVLSGNVISEGTNSVVRKGIAYGTVSNPTISNGRADAPTGGIGAYNVPVSGLVPNTNYNYRAYAQTSDGTVYYSAQGNFNTGTPTGLTYYDTFNGSTYYVSNSLVNLNQARQMAYASGGHLAIITSLAENNFISGMANGNNIWIGLGDSVREGTFVWDTGQSLAGFSRWNTGEPNNVGPSSDPDEDGVVMNWRDSGNGRWNDWHESNLARFVVEYDSQAAVVPIAAFNGHVYSNCTGPYGCTKTSTTVYSCQEYTSSYQLNPAFNGQYSELVLNYGDAACGSAPTPPAASGYRFNINILINGTTNISGYALPINQNTAVINLDKSKMPSTVSSISISWTNNYWVSYGGNDWYDPDFEIRSMVLR